MKKVLALVLTFALVLTSFSLAFADDATTAPTPEGKAGKALSDIAASPNKEAIGVVNDLGIVVGTPEGTFLPTKEVTRAEFAVMLTKALAIPNSALEGYSQTPFKDMAGYEWSTGYLAFCLSKGIMVGDGYGNAMPGRTVSLNEAVTMALRAIGYVDNSSELKGAWPANYVTKAQELDLYKDVAKDMVGATRENAAQIIYNLLPIQKVAVDTDGKTNPLWDVLPRGTNPGVETTLFSAGLNCRLDKEDVVVDSDVDNASINMAKNLGKYGKVYVNKKTNKIVAFLNESDKLVGRFTAANKFVTSDDEKEYTVKSGVDKANKLIVGNGKTTTNNVLITDATFTNGVYGANNNTKEYVLNVDLSGKTIKEIYSAVEWDVTIGQKVKASDLASIKSDKTLLNYKFGKDDNNEIAANEFELVGAATLADIKADDVVYVYDNDKVIRKIEVSNKTVEGVVKSFKDKTTDSKAKFTIGDKTFKNSKDVLNNVGIDADALVVGVDNVTDEVKAFLDARGYVFDFEKTAKARNYAVLEKIATGGIDNQAKLALADGTEKVFVYDANKTGIVAGDVDNLIGYGLNKDGKITEANRFFTKATIKLGNKYYIESITGANPANITITPAGPSGSPAAVTEPVGTTAKIANGVTVFVKKTNGDYVVSSIDKVDIGKSIADAILLFDKKNDGHADTYKVVAMIIPEANAKEGTKSYAVLNEQVLAANDAGDKVWDVKGFKDGVSLAAKTVDNTVFGTGYVAPTYTAGTALTAKVWEVRVDAKGVVTDATEVTATIGATGTLTPAAAKVYKTEDVIKVEKADGRRSVEGVKLGAADAYKLAISDKAVFYRVEDGEYKVFSGGLKKDDLVLLYETNSDNDGFDIVVFGR
jgi:S-layer domain protein